MLCHFCNKKIITDKNIKQCDNCLYVGVWRGIKLITEYFFYKKISSEHQILVSHEYFSVVIYINNFVKDVIDYDSIKITPKLAKELIYKNIKHNILK